MDPACGQVALVHGDQPNAPPKSFTFDGVYFMDSTAEQIYSDIVFPLVEVFEIFNIAMSFCIFLKNVLQ